MRGGTFSLNLDYAIECAMEDASGTNIPCSHAAVRCGCGCVHCRARKHTHIIVHSCGKQYPSSPLHTCLAKQLQFRVMSFRFDRCLPALTAGCQEY